MRVAVLGAGIVGRTLATRLTELRHQVMLGTRAPGDPKAVRWARRAGDYGEVGTYSTAVEAATLVINATAGTVSVQALRAVGSDALAGKVLVDVANPVVAPDADPPTLEPVGLHSLGEQIQQQFPRSHVVKTLNTVSPAIMVQPNRLPGHHVMFVAGNNRQAKWVVTGLLREFGWPQDNIIDLGDISGARSMEMLVPLRQRLSRSLGHTNFNIHIQHT
ncbi:NAD(P)-binding domain-containing protein [Saccharomonospora sp. NPDC046836]|uniref:NADPH-dependent F420 reductase n=1 Tax=Saccharomonospora sp. NPDC046836 TaxID=3156921 RepID=UPI0033FC6AB5